MVKSKNWVVFLFLFTVLYGGANHHTLLPYDYVPGEVVVKMKSTAISPAMLKEFSGILALEKGQGMPVTGLFAQYKLKSDQIAQSVGLNRIYKVYVKEDVDIRDLCLKLMQNSEVEWAEPVYIIPQDAIPNDPKYNEQSHLPQIKAPAAWDIVKGSKSVPIAIIDSGVDYKHPDLKDVIWINPGEDINHDGKITAADSNNVDDDGNGFVDDFMGWDFVTGVSGTGDNNAADDEDGETPDNDPLDVNGHGSHCAGLAAAATNNGIGVAGVSWGCSIMPIRIGWIARNGNGYGRSDWMAQAFIYAADNGAKVANLSYGTSLAVVEGARYAFLKDVAITCSAGNDSTNVTGVLATEPWTITVAAVDPYDVKAWYSNYGFHVTVAAPGGDHRPGLLSTTPNNSHNNNSYYNTYSGTSMASPVAAGVLGLIRSQHPEWDVVKAYYQLVGTADNIDGKNLRYSGKLGTGRINAYRAVTETVIPAPKIAFNGVEFYETKGNGNGIIEPNEEIDIIFHLQNYWAPAKNVKSKLIVNNNLVTPLISQVTLDSLYGFDNYDKDNNNIDKPLRVKIADDILPGIIPLRLVIETVASSDTFNFNIPVHAMVLFVEDNHTGGDGKDNPIAHYYTKCFDELGIAYEYWHNVSPLDSNYIMKFPIIVWACEWAFPSLDAHDRKILAKYLEAGGNLFLSGQDIGWDLADPTGTSNQWKASNGASKYFYEKYLASMYVNDDGGKSPISVAPGSFFKLPNFQFELPNRTGYQYPDVVVPRPYEGGYALLNYSTGTCAAVGADAPYHTVYFAFGGLEAITNEEIRTLTLQQIINHFVKLNVQVSELRNTEYKGPFEVSVKTNTTKEIITAKLIYQINSGPWNVVDMSQVANGIYQAQIPQVSEESAIVTYYVFIKASDGTYYADKKHSFYTGPDLIPPVASAINIPYNTIDRLGPYYTSFLITDNIAVDTANVFIHYFSSSNPEDSTALRYAGEGIWDGNFQFSLPAKDGDTVYFYLTFKDLGKVPNKGRLPGVGYYKFVIQNYVLVDNFEAGLGKWINEENFWGIYPNPSFMKDGIRCLVSGDGVKYPPNKNASITYKNQFNLRSRTRAIVKFIQVQMFDSAGDTAYFEIKVGDGNWLPLQKFYGANITKWTERVYDLSPYCGSDKEPISIRFRFLSDGVAGSKVGILIDKLEIFTDDAVEIKESPLILHKFELLPAYPNPFNATVNIPFVIPERGEVELVMYNILGNIIYHDRMVINQPGKYQFVYDSNRSSQSLVSSGVYFIKVQWNGYSKVQKVLMIK